jgi:hypothetical protein
MNCLSCVLLVLCAATSWAQTSTGPKRLEAEYYVAAYAQHYRVPVPLVRAVVERESNWRPCAISPKGAVGLMQLMPMTARTLRVSDRCNGSFRNSTVTCGWRRPLTMRGKTLSAGVVSRTAIRMLSRM